MTPKFRRIAIIAGLAIIIGAGFGVYSLLARDQVPADFRESRERGAYISERIVQNSSSLVKDLERVNELDKQKKYTEASALIDELSKRNEEIKKDAVELAKQLEVMTKAVIGIRNAEARSVAIEAINNELSVITHLLSYSDFVGRFFETLQDRFIRNKDLQVRSWIEEINKEVAEINNYNNQAKQAFEKFDSLVD